MKRKFMLHITGTVESDPDTARSEGQTETDEMKVAVEASFRPDLMWGVEMIEYTAFVFSKEIQ